MNPFLEVTTCLPRGGCSVACKFCPADQASAEYDKRGTGPRLMSVETFAACLAKMPPNLEGVSFAGFSEPFLNNKTTEMAEHCHAVGARWETYTTCVGMSESDVDRLVAAKPHRIKIHLPDEEGYAKIRVDDAYVRVVLKLADAFPVLFMTMGTLPAVFRPRFGEKLHPDFMHTRAGTVKALEARYLPRKRGPLRCRPGPDLDRPVLLPDGTLASCCYAFNMQHLFGNLLTQTWDEIRNGEGLASMRRAMASENDDCLCRTCEQSECV